MKVAFIGLGHLGAPVPTSLSVTQGLSATFSSATTPSLPVMSSPLAPPATASSPSLAAPQE